MLRDVHCKNKVIVIPADGLSIFSRKNMPPVGYSAIVNTHPGSKPGEHWVCVEVLSDEKILIFDSFASKQYLYNKYIAAFKNLFPKLERNEGLLQDPFSTSCGMFCVYFFHYRCNENMSMNSILMFKFSDDIVDNVCLVLQFIDSRYSRHLFANVKSTCR